MSRPLISVCVCTYQRPELLRALLDSLARQSRPDFDLEVIVVDNDKEASARPCVTAVMKSFPDLKLHYSVEAQQGISFARNRSVALASGDYYAFIDDDEVACVDWLAQHMATLKQTGADGGFGPVQPLYVEGTPEWLIAGRFFERPRFSTGTWVSSGDARTNNALLHASRINSLLPVVFDPAFAYSGGEDSDLFLRLARSGARYTWCDEALVSEIVPDERQKPRWMLERGLRSSTVYWRMHYACASRCYRLTMALSGVVMFLVLGCAGVLLRVAGPLHATRLGIRACKGRAGCWPCFRSNWKPIGPGRS